MPAQIDAGPLLTDLHKVTISDPTDRKAIERARTSGLLSVDIADRLSRRYLGIPHNTTTAGSAWMEHAACAGHPHNWWVPTSESDWKGLWQTPEARQARAICAGCPVASDCLDYATRLNLDDGIFGGLDPHQRKRLDRRRHADRCRCESCRGRQGGHAKAGR